MGVKGVDEMSQEEYRQAAIEAVRQLSKDVGIPEKNEKIREEDLEILAADALADACYPGNPREATKEQVIEMFRMLM
jgi:lactaldehyde reductase